MVQGYYTLEEASRILGVSADELNQMAQRREVRAFADRGTWRFRTQDIEEMARRRGLGSSADVQMGDAPSAKGADVAASRHQADDQVEIGQEIITESPSGSRKVAGKGSGKNLGPKTPQPKPGSDSDVRLVADGSDVGFQVAPGDGGPKSGARKKAGAKQDSGVRLVPMEPESDSDVRIVPDSQHEVAAAGTGPKTGSDSDIRIEATGSSKKLPKVSAEDSFLTEEIDLDAELRAAQETASSKKLAKTGKTPQPTSSPFELPDSDTKLQRTPQPSAKKPVVKTPDSSSDFELSLESSSEMSPLELSSGELAAMSAREDELSLGELATSGVTGSSDSGINLQEPMDSGISLEKGPDSSDELEFELTLEGGTTPKPKAKSPKEHDSSSEFELTIEDSAESKTGAKAEEEKDIFETDFEVPALEDESGSQAVALDESDTDLESSDFDLALGEDDAASEDASGSQVMALDEEGEADEAAATIARPRRKKAVAEEDEAAELEPAEEPEEEAVLQPVAELAPANWGVFVPVTLILSVVVMFFVGLMSMELLNGMWGYRKPEKVPSTIIKSVGGLMPWVDPKDLDK